MLTRGSEVTRVETRNRSVHLGNWAITNIFSHFLSAQKDFTYSAPTVYAVYTYLEKFWLLKRGSKVKFSFVLHSFSNR